MSNPGTRLYCAIADDDKARATAKRLLAPDMFSGWGIRTLSKSAAAYNPMSYHNGSVWPHDNALIAAGLKRYGFVRSTNRVATALFDAAIHADYLRLPELFCGFTRRSPNKPVSYPVACSPQAWAAGSPFLMLQSMLGISASAERNLLTVNEPHLPSWLHTVELRNLRVGVEPDHAAVPPGGRDHLVQPAAARGRHPRGDGGVARLSGRTARCRPLT